jgi:hypothetical protein
MSLVVDLAVLAEGAATDSRGNFTLVAANPHLLIAEELPVQFNLVFLAVVDDDEDDTAPPQILTPGAVVTAKVEVTGPDSETLFFAQLRQVVVPSPYPAMRPRFQIVAQVPFTASKTGRYRVSARIEVTGQGEQAPAEVTAARTVRVADRASLTNRPT